MTKYNFLKPFSPADNSNLYSLHGLLNDREKYKKAGAEDKLKQINSFIRRLILELYNEGLDENYDTF